MLDFNSNAIGNATPIANWITAMEKAFIDTAGGKIFVPQRSHIEYNENTLLLMPCFGENYFSTKLASVFPGNLKKGKPVISGTVVLNDGTTGEPLATFDGAKLTAMRTAAVGSIGIRYLAPPDSDQLGVIGLGIQGFHQALFACSQRPVKVVRIFDSSRIVMNRFRERFSAFYSQIDVQLCNSAEELCIESEIIITATGSQNPVIPGKRECWLGKTIIAIGSYKPKMKELPDMLLKSISKIYVDTRHGLKESGDLIDPVRKGYLREEKIITIDEIINGKDQPEEDTRVFKSVGMAAFDLYGAILVYENRIK